MRSLMRPRRVPTIPTIASNRSPLMTTQSEIDITESLAQSLVAISGLTLKENEPLSRHTSFGIGGPADLFAIPSTVEALCSAIAAANDVGIRPLILGNGTNLIVRDGGIRGLVISISGKMSKIEIDGTEAVIEAGALLATICHRLAGEGLSGFEFAAGIPGTLGGALIMNAGANGGEIGDVTEWVEVAAPDGTLKRVRCERLGFGYRCSALRDAGVAVVRAGLRLKPGDADEIHEALCDRISRRCAKQPVSSPSAGCIFKRPEGDYAGRLIEEAGAKGMCVGRASVSSKHANFMLNLGGATAADVIGLIDATRELVYDRFAVMLEAEVCVVGEDI